MTMRTKLTGATAALLIALAVPAHAQDLGGKISGAFTDAYKGLKSGVLDAYEGGTEGAKDVWGKTTKEIDKATGNAPANATTASAAPVMGDDLVLNVQTELNAAGYAAGRPDGVYGPRTANAIRAYQANNALPQDGQASIALLDHMRAKRAGQPVPAPTASYAPPALPTQVQPAPIAPAPVAGATTGTAAPALPALPGQAAAAPQAAPAPACKPYETRLMVDGKEQISKGTACLQADGTWKPVN